MAQERKTWNILVVDDEPNNLKVLQQILKDMYNLAFAKDGEKALIAAKKHKPDLILLDIMMPGMDGYEVCRRLKADRATSRIPVIFVTALTEAYEESKGFEVGGVDYITKPVSVPVVVARVATHLALYNQQQACEKTVRERTRELAESQRSAIFMLGEAAHYNDVVTGAHIWRMAAYSGALARAARWSVKDARMLELAAPMHDTGKIGIPDAILKKVDTLNEEEWEVMRNHPIIGHKILSKSKAPLFKMAADICLYHHEKWDGTGYPAGLRGEEVPESARIVTIADVFDAMTASRHYKEAWSVEQALAEMAKLKGSHFDPHLIELFFAIKDEIQELKDWWDEREADMDTFPVNGSDFGWC